MQIIGTAYNLSILDFKFKTDNNYDTVISAYNLSILDFKYGCALG